MADFYGFLPVTGSHQRRYIINYYETMTDYNNLLKAMKRIRKASGWKYSSQKILCNRLRTVNGLSNSIADGTYRQEQGYTFPLIEYGHQRIIKALTNRDLLVQHTLCDNILMPEISPRIIYDNGASIKGKGISFTRRRFEKHLRDYARKYGNDGYILLIDFRKYFDNIRHDRLLDMYDKALNDPWIRGFLQRIFESYKIDVSYTDSDCIDDVFSMQDYLKVPKELKTGKRYMAKSLGIGSPISQISGIFFPHLIDWYIKTVCGCKWYGAYMDDRYLIHRSKYYLKERLAEIRELSKRLGLHINEKKTQIVKISHGFTWLKTRYYLYPTGRLVRKIPIDGLTRERRKLKKLAVDVADGKLELKAYKNQYLSWRGSKKEYNAHDTIKSMDRYYRRQVAWIKQKKSDRKSSISSPNSPVPNQILETGNCVKSSRQNGRELVTRMTQLLI